MTLKVITLHKSNHRQAAPTLRKIADEIEAGEYGKVGSIAVALLGDRLEVFAAGPSWGSPGGVRRWPFLGIAWRCSPLALLGDRLEVFAAGPDADGTAAACLLQAGATKIINALVNHGADQ